MKKLLFASTEIENREEQLAVLYEEIEQGLKVKLTSSVYILVAIKLKL